MLEYSEWHQEHVYLGIVASEVIAALIPRYLMSADRVARLVCGGVRTLRCGKGASYPQLCVRLPEGSHWTLCEGFNLSVLELSSP